MGSLPLPPPGGQRSVVGSPHLMSQFKPREDKRGKSWGLHPTENDRQGQCVGCLSDAIDIQRLPVKVSLKMEASVSIQILISSVRGCKSSEIATYRGAT